MLFPPATPKDLNLSKTFLILPAVSIFVAAAVGAGACSSSTSVTFAPPPGSTDLTTPYGTCDTTNGYAEATAAICDGVTCSSGTYYALCDGSEYTVCTCDVPSGSEYTVITDPGTGFPDETGDDAKGDDDAGDDAPSSDDAGDDAVSTEDAGNGDDAPATSDDDATAEDASDNDAGDDAASDDASTDAG